jgi:hypothetical protein
MFRGDRVRCRRHDRVWLRCYYRIRRRGYNWIRDDHRIRRRNNRVRYYDRVRHWIRDWRYIMYRAAAVACKFFTVIPGVAPGIAHLMAVIPGLILFCLCGKR